MSSSQIPFPQEGEIHSVCIRLQIYKGARKRSPRRRHRHAGAEPVRNGTRMRKQLSNGFQVLAVGGEATVGAGHWEI